MASYYNSNKATGMVLILASLVNEAVTTLIVIGTWRFKTQARAKMTEKPKSNQNNNKSKELSTNTYYAHLTK